MIELSSSFLISFDFCAESYLFWGAEKGCISELIFLIFCSLSYCFSAQAATTNESNRYERWRQHDDCDDNDDINDDDNNDNNDTDNNGHIDHNSHYDRACLSIHTRSQQRLGILRKYFNPSARLKTQTWVDRKPRLCLQGPEYIKALQGTMAQGSWFFFDSIIRFLSTARWESIELG